MPTQTGSIDFASTGGFKSYATNKYATQSTASQMQSAIEQNAQDITLRATKTEVQQVRPAYASSSTAAGTAAKVATIDPAVTGYALYKGASVAVTFSTANTAATPTLNLNSTGAKQIRSYTGATLSEAEYKWAAGATIDLVYDGTYWRMQDGGSVKRVTAAEASISVNAENIESKVSKDGVISSINQSAETVKIQASRVEIDGTAVFSAISSDVDDAITSKGYATTTQAQGYASTAKSEAISAAATDATTKANAAENNAKAYTDALEIGGRNLFAFSNAAIGYIRSSSPIGDVVLTPNNPQHRTSDYIPASPDDVFTMQMWNPNLVNNTSNSNRGVAFYDSSKTYISMQTGTGDANGSRPTGVAYWSWTADPAPANTAYARFGFIIGPSTNTVDEDIRIKVEKGNKATDWSPAPEDIEANAVKRTQRIWYRKSASGAPSTPGTASSNWVTKADDGNDAWTKMHIAISSTHKYIYTCEQYEMANGTVGYTSVLLDNTITVIDGGNIITGTVTANKLNAADINASKSLTVGAMTDAAASTILNSNIQIGGRNLLTGSSDMTKCFTHLNKVTSIAGGYSDPDGGNNAYLITPNATSWYAGPAGGRLLLTSLTTSYTFSVWLRADSATQCKLCCRYMDTTPYSSNAARVTFDVTTEWQRYHISAPLKQAQTSDSIWIGQVTTTPIYVYHPMVEMSSNPSDWTPAPEDVESSIIEASKTASNYITADSTGIKIHMSGSTSTYQHQSSTATTYYVNGNKRAEVGTDGLKVYVGTTGTESSVAEFGTTARVGSASGPNVYVESGGVSVRDGTTGVVKFSGAAATGSYTRSSSVELAGWNGTALRMRGDLSTDNRYIGLESGFGSLLAVRHTDSVTEYGSFEGNDFVELEAEGMSINGTTVDMDKQVLPAFLTQSGMVAQSVSASANAVTSYTVTFPIPYEASPIVTACFYSTSTAAAFGGLSLAVSAITTTSFTVKIFNNTGTGRTLGIFWIATPQTTLT